MGKPAMGRIVCLALVPFLVVGCTSIDPGNTQDPRSALAGGMLAGPLGAGLDKQSLRRAVNAEYQALENGTAGAPVTWQAGDARTGSVTPGPRYQIGERFCRR